MDGRIKKVEDFLKTRLLDTLTEQLSKVTKVPDYYTPALQFALIVNVNKNRCILKNLKCQPNFSKLSALWSLLK